MISHIKGTLFFRGSKYILVTVPGLPASAGISLKVFTSAETLKGLPKKDSPVELFTHLYVRENALDLYGFATMAELEFFEMLIGVSGIGPKSAIGVMSVAPLDTLKHAIASGESTYLTKISGIGRRIAEKMIVELRDKLGGAGESAFGTDESDALDALVSLGYTTREAREALRKVPADAISIDEKIKTALKVLGR